MVLNITQKRSFPSNKPSAISPNPHAGKNLPLESLQWNKQNLPWEMFHYSIQMLSKRILKNDIILLFFIVEKVTAIPKWTIKTYETFLAQPTSPKSQWITKHQNLFRKFFLDKPRTFQHPSHKQNHMTLEQQ